MESCGFVDSVKAEMANALAQYRRLTNFAKLFQFIEVFVAVALISWSSTRVPLVLKFSGEYLTAFSSYLMNQHVVFLVGNVIVVVCYVLSRHPDSGNDLRGSGIYYDDGKYSQLNQRKISVDVKQVPSASRVTESPITRKSVEEESQNRIIQNEEPITKMESEVTAETAIKQAVKKMEKFQRTQSDKLNSQISSKPRRELRRSVTEKKRTSIARDGESTVTSFQALDRLSIEEFRIVVEAFISKQHSFLKQQSMVDNGS